MYCLDRSSPDVIRRPWEQWHDKQAPREWRIDPRRGVVQGPLDLCFLDGRTLHLVLAPGQVALLASRGQQRAFFPDGTYLLAVGENGLPSDSLIYFMHTDRNLRIAWSQVIPVPHACAGTAATRRASGDFHVRIDSPVRFHEQILRNRAGEGEAICADVLASLMPTLMTIRLARSCGPGGTSADQRDVLAALRPTDLDADLEPYGLSCTALSIDAAFLSEDSPQPA